MLKMPIGVHKNHWVALRGPRIVLQRLMMLWNGYAMQTLKQQAWEQGLACAPLSLHLNCR